MAVMVFNFWSDNAGVDRDRSLKAGHANCVRVSGPSDSDRGMSN